MKVLRLRTLVSCECVPLLEVRCASALLKEPTCLPWNAARIPGEDGPGDFIGFARFSSEQIMSDTKLSYMASKNEKHKTKHKKDPKSNKRNVPITSSNTFPQFLAMYSRQNDKLTVPLILRKGIGGIVGYVKFIKPLRSLRFSVNN